MLLALPATAQDFQKGLAAAKSGATLFLAGFMGPKTCLKLREILRNGGLSLPLCGGVAAEIGKKLYKYVDRFKVINNKFDKILKAEKEGNQAIKDAKKATKNSSK